MILALIEDTLSSCFVLAPPDGGNPVPNGRQRKCRSCHVEDRKAQLTYRTPLTSAKQKRRPEGAQQKYPLNSRSLLPSRSQRRLTLPLNARAVVCRCLFLQFLSNRVPIYDLLLAGLVVVRVASFFGRLSSWPCCFHLAGGRWCCVSLLSDAAPMVSRPAFPTIAVIAPRCATGHDILICLCSCVTPQCKPHDYQDLPFQKMVRKTSVPILTSRSSKRAH